MHINTLRVLLMVCAIAAVPVGETRAQDVVERVCENHLVSITPDGEVARGSKAAAVAAVESGKSLRVGFGLGSGSTGGFYLTHWFEGVFLTVIQNNVFTQTPIIHGQRPTDDDQDIDLHDTANRWVGTLGTNGLLHSKRLLEDNVVDFKVYSWWCLAE